MIACYITGLEYNPERRQDPSFVDKKHIRMRKFDTDTNSYTTQQGNAFTVERMITSTLYITNQCRHMDQQYKSKITIIGTNTCFV